MHHRRPLVRERIVLAAFTVAQSANVHAQVLPATLQVCADQLEDRQRLACYDREVAQLRTLASAKPNVAAPSPAEAFGLRGPITVEEQAHQTAQQNLEQITARIVKLAKQPHGEYVVTLDNDQVWEQKSSIANFHLMVGEQITIKRGLLGAFTLINSTRRTASVTRRR